MFDLNEIMKWLSGLSPVGLYSALFFISFLENIFPPSPSDVIIIFIATLVGIGTIGYTESIVVSTLGSITGFLLAFWLGRRYGRKWIEEKRFKFFDESSFQKVDVWFQKYGYGVIVANRFLAGTRAIISFFAGMSNLKLLQTTVLCGLSALVWNFILIKLGQFLGNNWEFGAKILSRYNTIILALLFLAVTYFVVKYFINKNKSSNV